VTVSVWLPTVMMADREEEVGLATADQVKDPLPLPLPMTVSQDWLLVGVQARTQFAGDPVTVTEPLLPPDGTAMVPEGLRVSDAHEGGAAPACVTVTVWPPTVMMADREEEVGLAVADQVKDPLPLPLPVTVNQGWLL
jgi:hypothetical protein